MKIDEKKMLEILAEMVKLLIDTIYEYEKKYPNDNRPQKAIEAAKQYLKRPCKETSDAANAAAAVDAQEIVDCEMQGLIEKTEKEWKADYYEDYFIKAKNELKEERNETNRPND